MYLTYEEYQAYGGQLDETSFNDLEYDAESTVNWYTFNRLKKPEWAAVLNTEELKIDVLSSFLNFALNLSSVCLDTFNVSKFISVLIPKNMESSSLLKKI